MRIAVLLALTSVAAADASLPSPDWSACAARFAEARSQLGRRDIEASVAVRPDSVVLSADGVLIATVAATRAADHGWLGDNLSTEQDEAIAVDCPPDGPRFERTRVSRGREGSVSIDRVVGPRERIFWRILRRAIDDCLDTHQ